MFASAHTRSLISDLNALDTDPRDSFDQSFIVNSNCKYYNCEEFKTLASSTKSNFSALHLNIASLSRHFDEFDALLALLDFDFSVIGISETRFLKHAPPTFDFSLKGYE